MSTGDLVPELARIPGGEFSMGSDHGAEDERPVHRVHVDEFFIGVYEVTNQEYARFIRVARHLAPAVRELPLLASRERDAVFRQFASPYIWKDGVPPPGRATHPVTLVRYEDAVAYCEWLAARTGRPFRLPTEAEWEKGARGGLDSKRYPWGDEIDTSRANYLSHPSLKPVRGTRPVGSYAPNAYGLYDMAGNVWEWVSGWYSQTYATGESKNPRGSSSGSFRIVRGGGWANADAAFLRCACRHKVPPDTYAYSIGFRIACSAR